MARKKDVDKMSQKELVQDLTKDEKKLIEDIKLGRFDPVYFAESLLGIEMHDAQKLWLWMTTKTQRDKACELGVKLNDENRRLWGDRVAFELLLEKNPDFLRNILVPSNRWGKTTITSIKHLWYNFYKIGVRGSPQNIKQTRCGTLNLSPHSNQCQAGYEYILDVLFSRLTYTVNVEGKAVSKVNKCRIPDFYIGDNTQKRMITFKNGTFYKAIPTGEDQASSLAGNPYLYISYDECAQSLHLKAELPAKIMSRLIDFGGPLDLVSTPEVDKPSHQYFYHISKLGLKAEEGWFTLVGRLTDNIFLGEKEVNQVIGSIKATDPVKYRQVVYGEFVTTGKKMFDQTLIERLWDEERPRMPEYEHLYLLWADWGFSDTGDPTVFYVLDYTPSTGLDGKKITNKYRVVYRESIRGGSPYAVLPRARILQREWNNAKFGHDSAAMGGVMIKKMLYEMGMHDIIDFGAEEKADMLFCMIVVMSEWRRQLMDAEGKVKELNPDFGRLRSYYIPELEEQLGNYQYNPDKGITDKKLEQDDVMCLGMAIWWLERKYNKAAHKSVAFNPLAPTADKIIPEGQDGALKMRVVNIPERRIG